MVITKFTPKAMKWFEKLPKKVELPIGILADLQGPKIRLGRFKDDIKVKLKMGDPFIITTREILGDERICSTTFKGLCGDVNAGDLLLIYDGKVTLKAEKVTDDEVHCLTVIGGKISNNKGINLPGVAINVPALSERDGELFPVTMDYRTDRINASIRGGLVADVSIG
jgi:pyruvate kinase